MTAIRSIAAASVSAMRRHAAIARSGNWCSWRHSPALEAIARSSTAATIWPSTAIAAAAWSGSPTSPRTIAISDARARVLDEEVADRQVVEMPLQERAHRVLGRAHDRLLVHVEAGVDH